MKQSRKKQHLHLTDFKTPHQGDFAYPPSNLDRIFGTGKSKFRFKKDKIHLMDRDNWLLFIEPVSIIYDHKEDSHRFLKEKWKAFDFLHCNGSLIHHLIHDFLRRYWKHDTCMVKVYLRSKSCEAKRLLTSPYHRIQIWFWKLWALHLWVNRPEGERSESDRIIISNPLVLIL